MYVNNISLVETSELLILKSNSKPQKGRPPSKINLKYRILDLNKTIISVVFENMKKNLGNFTPKRDKLIKL